MPDSARFNPGDRVLHTPSGMASTVLPHDHVFVSAMITEEHGEEMVYVELDISEPEGMGPIGDDWQSVPQISDPHKFRILDPREVRRVTGPDPLARPQPPPTWADE